MSIRHLLITAVAVAALSVSALVGCSSDPLAQQYLAGDNKNYIAGDGSVTEIAIGNRGKPIEFSGETQSGAKVSSAQYRGHVLVVNFWYAGCAPCRAEAGDLEKVYNNSKGAGTNFLGVNVRDQAATIVSFNEKFGITYPSVIDQNGPRGCSVARPNPDLKTSRAATQRYGTEATASEAASRFRRMETP